MILKVLPTLLCLHLDICIYIYIHIIQVTRVIRAIITVNIGLSWLLDLCCTALSHIWYLPGSATLYRIIRVIVCMNIMWVIFIREMPVHPEVYNPNKPRSPSSPCYLTVVLAPPVVCWRQLLHRICKKIICFVLESSRLAFATKISPVIRFIRVISAVIRVISFFY